MLPSHSGQLHGVSEQSCIDETTSMAVQDCPTSACGGKGAASGRAVRALNGKAGIDGMEAYFVIAGRMFGGTG
jgi:hypothetical protein